MKYNKNGDRGLTVVRALLLAAAVVVVIVLGYRQVARLTEKHVPVWVSAGPLVKGRAVMVSDMKVTQVPPPSGVLVSRTDIEGRTLLADKPEGQPFYPTDLAPRPPKPALATTIPEGRLLATLRFESMDLPAQELLAGDRIDILLAAPDGVHVVAHDAYVLGLLTQRAASNGEAGKILGVDVSVPGTQNGKSEGSALVLGIYPEEVFSLAAAEATGKQLKLVLHADREVKAGEVIDLRPEPPLPPPPPPAEPPSVEVLMGTKSERVRVR